MLEVFRVMDYDEYVVSCYPANAFLSSFTFSLSLSFLFFFFSLLRRSFFPLFLRLPFFFGLVRALLFHDALSNAWIVKPGRI